MASTWSFQRVRRGPSPALAGLLCLLVVNSLLTHQQFTTATGIFLLLGVAFWLAALRGERVERDPAFPVQTATRPDWRFVAAAGVLAVVAYDQAAGNQFRTLGVIGWVGAVACWLIGWWPARSIHLGRPSLVIDLSAAKRRVAASPAITTAAAIAVGASLRLPPLLLGAAWFLPWEAGRRRGGGTGGWSTEDRRRLLGVLAVCAVVVVGGWFRLHNLAETPSDPTSDHAEKILDVNDLLNGQRSIFFPRNTGRETAQFYVTAFGLVRGLGMPADYNTLKFGTAMTDTAAVIAVFLLASELLGFAGGICAAGLFAMNAWPVVNARFGLRPSYGPLTAGLALWALMRYLRTGHRRDALLTGTMLGLGLYGYTGFRTVPIATVAILAAAFLFDPRQRGRRRTLVLHSALIVSTAWIVFIPLGRFMIDPPDVFWYRARTRAGSAERDLGGGGLWNELSTRLPTFWHNNLRMLGAFNWKGDSAFVNFVVGQPLLDLFSGALLLGGTVVALHRIVADRSIRFAGLAIAFPILALSSTLALAFPNEVPSASRSSLLAPVIFTLAALPLSVLVRRVLAPDRDHARAWLCMAALALAALVANRNYDRYYHDYDAQYRASIVNTTEIAQSIKGASDEGVAVDHAYILGVAFCLDHRNVAVALGDMAWADAHNIVPDQPIPDQVDGRPMLFIVNLGDSAGIGKLTAKWPSGVFTVVHSTRLGKDFGTFFVPVSASAWGRSGGTGPAAPTA